MVPTTADPAVFLRWRMLRSSIAAGQWLLPSLLALLFVSLADATSRRLILGLNKYSHDAAICVIDALEEKVLFSQAKERLSGRKHEGGAVGELVAYALRYLQAEESDVHTVVSNNHHFRVLPFERRVPWAVATNYVPADYADRLNLLPAARHLELSHHLAHAWSVAGSAPFPGGLVLVMDGMGESYRAMREDMSGVETTSDYMHDLRLLKKLGADGFVGVPTVLQPSSGYREAESAYVFDGSSLRPVFKRWTRERSPSELFNHGFENMESLGAVYSRISAHLLGDWNACGKVMGLSSWAGKHRRDSEKWIFGEDTEINLGFEFHHKYKLMTGNPFSENEFKVDWDIIDSLPDPNQFEANNFGRSAVLAASVQSDLESSALELVASLKSSTNQANLALAGGVALNSVLNGRILKEGGFENVYIPPGPGDEGVAVGCAMYGLHRFKEEAQSRDAANDATTPIKRISFGAYQGASFDDEAVREAVSEYGGWIEVQRLDEERAVAEDAADALSEGKVVAWFQGRSEFGQRALGSRSILADPRREEVRRFVNERVKQREWWRPLAPSVLEEYSREWFDLDTPNASPYMSITCTVREQYRERVPAICHIDASARLQVNGNNNAKHVHYNIFCRLFWNPTIPCITNLFQRFTAGVASPWCSTRPSIESPSRSSKRHRRRSRPFSQREAD